MSGLFRKLVLLCTVVSILALAPIARAQLVRDVAGDCSAPDRINPLSHQVVATHLCRYGGLASFAGIPRISTAPRYAAGMHPYGTPAMVAGLRRVSDRGTSLVLNAGFRSMVQQYVMSLVGHTCYGVGVATPPGGTHAAGCAVDMDSSRARARAGVMNSAGFSYWGSRDPVHFSFRGCQGSNGTPSAVSRDDVRAFQVLWNANHPGDHISVNGNFDATTRDRLLRSPIHGFPHDGCAPDHDGDGSPEGEDCDDYDPTRSPNLPETCDGVDNDCDVAVDEDVSRTCGSDVGACRTGVETCTAGTWGACVGSVAAVDESCDMVDDDCDDAVDEDRICEHEDAALAAQLFAPPGATDVDGDGRADACMRTPTGFECFAGETFGFDRTLRGPAMADEDGWSNPLAYTSVRMGDVDGDGHDDVCARSTDRVTCWPGTADGFGDSLFSVAVGAPSPGAHGAEMWLADVDGDHRADVCVRGVDGLSCHPNRDAPFDVLPALSDSAGFDDVGLHGTIRFGDVDGDGRDDVCARTADGLRCWIAGDRGFDATVAGPPWSDAGGWNEPRYASTFRLADANGDGRADACIRGPNGFACWLSAGRTFGDPRRGPTMSGDEGWDDRSVYATIRMADVDGDRTRDLCARTPDGARCWLWTGADFGEEIVGPALSDEAGWNAPPRYMSLRLADVDGDGRADLCGRDADGLHCWISDGRTFSSEWRASAWSDLVGLSDPAFASTLSIAGTNPHVDVAGGCGCRVHGGRPRGEWPFPVGLVGLALASRRRRRREASHRRTGRRQLWSESRIEEPGASR